MRQPLPSFSALFSVEERQGIYGAPMFRGRRHPIWVPLFGEDQSIHAGHRRLEQSVRRIISVDQGKTWLEGKKTRLLDRDEVNNASAAMAEIRVFGGLLEAGFDVKPVAETDEPTPDFVGTAGDQQVAFEVASKLQDRAQDELQEQIHDAIRGKAPVPEGVGFCVHRGERNVVTMFESVQHPFGRPNPAKPNDSVQTNAISRVCRIKDDERQIPDDGAAVLVVDFNDFGSPLAPHSLVDQTVPMIAGVDGFTSGALWYAFYGWKCAPVFEGRRRVNMEHNGRFRRSGEGKSKLSAALLVMPKHVVCFENAGAKFPLTEDTRLRIARFPWFDLKHSVLEWEPGDVGHQVELHSRMIRRLKARFNDIRWR